MKKVWIILSIMHYAVNTVASQEIPVQVQQQLENRANAGDEETEDDTYWQDLEKLSRNPLNLNTATAGDLKELGVLNDWQVENFLRYRSLFGKLIDLHELQAVPSWHPALIRRLMPFLTIAATFSANDGWRERLRNGTHTFLIRVSQVMQASKGFDEGSTGIGYEGSPQKIFARYRYSYKNLLQFGWLGDKDAGESFFSGSQRQGFDFNSFHLFARKAGCIQALALGDFTVNMGQGLIHWQSLAFKKSGETMNIKRQSPVLHPYNSAGEFNFHRGAGITVRKRNIELTGFVSFRKLSANEIQDTLSRPVVSSIQTSGYHRTAAEISDKNVLSQFSYGANLSYKRPGWHAGINAVYYQYSMQIEKRDEPYNLYAIKGNDWLNMSVDYSCTYRNIHFFGEAAVDRDLHTAFLNGCMISVDPKMDLSFVYRRIAKKYQAVNANAFTENTSPVNENGLYAGLSIRPVANWKLDAFADVYQFPWLKYLVDAPSYGKDFFLQLIYTPDKKLEWQTRITKSFRLANSPDNITAMNFLSAVHRTGWQTQLNYMMSPAFTCRSRLQVLWLKGDTEENGYSLHIDGVYKPPMKPFSLSVRLQYFETTGYDSRLYAYENDVLYGHAIPALFGTGYRYYLIAQVKPAKAAAIGIRWAETIYTAQTTIGSGLDSISGSRKTELKLQVVYTIN